ncbi:MAG: hypothetical protein GF329_11490 [Candidatus Lokiarchaeota archaeon]|nr:hypothetical protein [Candidatus Lokiarchaeota archaeon]
MMDFKERILTTFNHEEPDRVPVMSLFMEPANYASYSGKSSTGYLNLLKKPILKDFFRLFMNWSYYYTKEVIKAYKKIIQTSVELGFDANWLMYVLFKIKKEKGHPYDVIWWDVWGRIWEIKLDPFGNPEPQYISGYITSEEKFDEWITEKEGLISQYIKYAKKFHLKLSKEFEDKIYVVPFAAPGIFENTWQPIGFINFSKFMYEKPRFIEKVVNFQTDLYLRLIDVVCETGKEIILIGDDLGQKTGPLINPKLLERFFGSAYKRISDHIHKKGRKVVFHSCGNLYKLLDKFIDWGFDGLITLEPTASMDLKRVRELVGHDLVLIGNLDVSDLLVRGSKKEIEAAVKKAIRDAAPSGGYILSPSHSHSEVDPNRLKWMIEAAHKFGEYPLDL